MKARIFLSIILLVLGLFNSKANTEHPNITEHNSNIENWLFGNYQEANHSMIVYFDVQEYEFLEYCTMNNIDGFSIQFFTKIGSSDDYQTLSSETIENVYTDFNASTWSHSIDGFINNTPITEYYFQITLNGIICGDILPLVLQEDEEEEEEEVPLPIELPEFTCGESFTPTPSSNMNPHM